MTRLCYQALAKLPSSVVRPSYTPKSITPAIVHLGIGAFHRAHQAYYTHLYMNDSKDTNWGIVGVSLRKPDVAEQLNPQDGLYTLVEQSNEGSKYEVIASIVNVLVAPSDPRAVIAQMAHDDTKIVSLTVTEKGYCHDPATGKLNLAHPDIVYDLENFAQPRSAIGFLASSLYKRFLANLAPFTVLCCDNLPNNGTIVSLLVQEFANKIDPQFAQWIADTVNFPCTMVDCIVPATQAQDIEDLNASIGVTDKAMVKAEPFKQWVIEDKFSLDRPKWENYGVSFVKDVAAFEDMKLRLLNGSHSSLAYIGFLSGCEYVSDAMQNEAINVFIRGLMEQEISPAVKQPEKIDLSAYKEALRERFSNKALKHKTYQIAMDGSQKLPQRLLNTLDHLLQKELPHNRIAFVLAAWMHYVKGVDAAGKSYLVQDPLLDKFKQIERNHEQDTQQKVLAYFHTSEIFKPSFVQHSSLINIVTKAYRLIEAHGMLGGLTQFDSEFSHD